MANIQSYLDQIANAVYGEEIRSSIINSLQKVNDDNDSYADLKKEVIAARDDINDQVDQFDKKMEVASEISKKLEEDTASGNQTHSDLTNSITTAQSERSKLESAYENVGKVVESANEKKDALDASLSSANTAKTNLDGSVTTATTTEKSLDETIQTSEQRKKNLDSSITSANKIFSNLNDAITSANNAKSNLTQVTDSADSAKTALDESTETAGTVQETLSATVKQADALDASLGEKIETGIQLKTDLVASGEKVVQDIQAAGSEQLGKMQAVAEAFTADREQIATNKEDIGSLKEDIDDCLKVKYLELKQDNLINIDNLTVGVCDSDGSFKDDTKYRRTDYEFVKPNTTYSSWRMIWRNALGIVRIAFFDKNKKFISGGRDIGNIFITPSDAYYVILSYMPINMTEERMPMVCEGNNVPEVYLPYKNEYIKKVVEYVKKDDLKPHTYMPDVIYCALGRTIDIYNNQVCIDADKFHLCWTCDIGFGEGRKFTVVPSTIGDYSLKLDIYDNNNILVWTKTSTLKVVNAKTSGSITILPIGDSMTYGGATWQDEVSNKLSNGAITYVGSLEHDYRGTNYNHEGYNGATASNFLNSEMLRGLTNPFYNPDISKFDWNYYKNNTRISPDVVQIELGTNDINGGTIEQAVSNIAEMVDLIRKDDANIPIFICNAIYRSNQNGIAHQLSTQGYRMGNGVYKYGEDIKIQSLMVSLVEKFTDYKNVYFIPLALCHDSENNFGKQKISLNSRSQETIIIPADSIHPNKTGEDTSIYGYDIVGYLQFADIMFSTFSGLVN